MEIKPSKSSYAHSHENYYKKQYPCFYMWWKVYINDISIYLLGCVNEHLDYAMTAKHVANSDNRALGRLISKCKIAGGLPFNTNTKLYDSMVWPTISYAAGIWGTNHYSCIEAVQNRASRFYLCVGRYTPNAAVQGDIEWLPSIKRQWKGVINLYYRMCFIDDDRINSTWLFELSTLTILWIFFKYHYEKLFI